MKANSDYSKTAEGMALLRAIEQFRHESDRILDDPHAADFLQHPIAKSIGKSRLLAGIYSLWFSRFAPGAQATLVTRARLVDDIASSLSNQGLKQIVVLGAGFDLMAARCRYELQDVAIFELDHPATQAIKRSVISDWAPGNLRMIPVNFERENFTEKLLDNGFDAEAKTLFSWLGVTYYLTKRAIEKTFGLLSGLARPGSHLIFDYLLSSVLDGTIEEKAALRHAKFVARIGEPWLWGIAPEQLAEYLAGFDFQLLTDFDAVKLRDVYRHDRALMDYIRIAHCIKA